uniref:leucine-rich repeat protein n=1 Tax=Pseudobutyrivibrio sp. TaxID=2014367 RepID=UPI00386AF217
IEQNTNGDFSGDIADEKISQTTRAFFNETKLKHTICSVEDIISKTKNELEDQIVSWYSERYPLINFSIVNFREEIPDFTAIDIYERGSSSFVMPYNNVLKFDLFDNFPYKNNIREFVIDRYFDYDNDTSSHFHNLPYLEKFIVIQPSPFSVEDGVLYIDNCDELEECEMLFDFTEKPQGRILVAFPPNHPAKKFVIPSDVVAICNSAFAYSKLEELTIPDSVEQINFCAFANMENLKIMRVPNKMIKMRLDHYDIKPTDFELHSNKEGISLDDEIVRFWNEVRNREPHYDWSHYCFKFISVHLNYGVLYVTR